MQSYALINPIPLTIEEKKALIRLLKMGTKEWCKKELNFMICGCLHACLYCYAKGIACRFKRCNIYTWNTAIIHWKQIKKSYRKVTKQGNQPYDIMIPTAHDIYPNYFGLTPDQLENASEEYLQDHRYLDACITLLTKLVRVGNRILITTKPHLAVVEEICRKLDAYKELITFRFTIGSIDSKILKLFEPNAPSFEERLQALQYATNHGFYTTISAEPLLDTDPTKLITTLEPHLSPVNYKRDIGTIWLGLLKTKYISNIERKPEVTTFLKEYKQKMTFDHIYSIYEQYFTNDRIKFKESILKLMIKHNIQIKLHTK